MFARNQEPALIMFSLVSLFYVVLTLLILWRARSSELKLIGIGVLTALLAVWCSQLPGGDGISLQASPGQSGQVGWTMGASSAAGIMGRIASVLTLAGIAIILLNHLNFPAASSGRMEPSDAKL
jgi:hypothetical protein